jgi:hypothetical protein
MKIYIPYTEIQPATRIALIGYEYIPKFLLGEYGYQQYFKDRWDDGESFINIEHDCVPWGGSIDELENCPELWCCFDYSLPNHKLRSLEEEVNGIPLGLMKISGNMIKQLKGCWDKPVFWYQCDIHLTKTALEHGLKVHQHYPSIINANAVLAERIVNGI